MDAIHVETERIPVKCCPKFAPCPHCGKKGRRKDKHERTVRTIAYKRIVVLDITVGEYRARCDCCKTFRSTPDGIDPRWQYDNKVRQAVLDRILEDGMSVQRVRVALKRDFLLDLSEGFVYDCLRHRVGELDMAGYRQWVLEHFSGTMCVDELHLGKFTLLLATDPLGDFAVAFALVNKNDQDHMRRFLQNLKHGGLQPEVVITDGSNLYPTLLAELWPEARHQLCVFHVIRDIHKHVLDAVKRLRCRLSRQGRKGRRRKRGRPTKAQRRGRRKQKQTAKQKAHFVFKNRYLIVRRRDELKDAERDRLKTMIAYLPELKTLRDFVDRIERLFEADQSLHQAHCRRAKLVGTTAFQEVPELAQAFKMLTPEKFEKMVAFLHSPAARRVRTNNHVERCNRKLRYYEKVRYKWRRRRTIVRFLVLAVDHLWRTTYRCTKVTRRLEQTPPSTKTKIKKQKQLQAA